MYTNNNGTYRDRKASCSVSSELSVDGAHVLDHLSTLLEQRGLICTDREWPVFGNDDEDDNRSLTDQLLDIKPQIKTEDIEVESCEIGKLLFLHQYYSRLVLLINEIMLVFNVKSKNILCLERKVRKKLHIDLL